MKRKAVCYSIIGTVNLGDLMSNPADYFPQLEAVKRDIFDWSFKEPHISIFGGGGLLHPDLIDALCRPHAIAWGLGCNTHGVKNGIWPKFLDNYILVGLRDRGNPWRWVPCSSCMHPEFDRYQNVKPVTEMVVYEHYHHPIPRDKIRGCVMRNSTPKEEFPNVIDFLASGETVLTNTYHGAFWATLLGRKVLIYQPFSNRFYHMRFQPQFVGEHDNIRDALEIATLPPEAFLTGCRAAVQTFADAVLQFLQQ